MQRIHTEERANTQQVTLPFLTFGWHVTLSVAISAITAGGFAICSLGFDWECWIWTFVVSWLIWLPIVEIIKQRGQFSIRCFVLMNVALVVAMMFPFQAIRDAKDRAAVLRGSDVIVKSFSTLNSSWGWTQEGANAHGWLPNVLAWRLPKNSDGDYGFEYLEPCLALVELTPDQLGVQLLSSRVCQEFYSVQLKLRTHCDSALQQIAGENLRRSKSMYRLSVNARERLSFGARKHTESHETLEFVQSLPDASELFDRDWSFAPIPIAIGKSVLRPGKGVNEWSRGPALVLSEVHLSNRSMERLLLSTGLKEVELINCDFSGEEFSLSDKPFALRELKLDSLKGGQFTSEGLRYLLMRLPELRRLEINARLVTPRILATISQMPQLEELRIEVEENEIPPVKLSEILAAMSERCRYLGVANGDWSAQDSMDSIVARENRCVVELIAASINPELLLNILRSDKNFLVQLESCSIDADQLRQCWIKHEISVIDNALSNANGWKFVTLLAEQIDIPSRSAVRVRDETESDQPIDFAKISIGSRLLMAMFHDCKNLLIGKAEIIEAKVGDAIFQIR